MKLRNNYTSITHRCNDFYDLKMPCNNIINVICVENYFNGGFHSRSAIEKTCHYLLTHSFGLRNLFLTFSLLVIKNEWERESNFISWFVNCQSMRGQFLPTHFRTPPPRAIQKPPIITNPVILQGVSFPTYPLLAPN